MNQDLLAWPLLAPGIFHQSLGCRCSRMVHAPGRANVRRCSWKRCAGYPAAGGSMAANGCAGRSWGRCSASVLKCQPRIHVKRSGFVVADAGAWITNLVRPLDGRAPAPTASGNMSRSRKGPSREGDCTKPQAYDRRKISGATLQCSFNGVSNLHTCFMRHPVAGR